MLGKSCSVSLSIDIDNISAFFSREKAIKDLLARSAARLDDWISSGLVGSLKLPATWIDEAKVG